MLIHSTGTVQLYLLLFHAFDVAELGGAAFKRPPVETLSGEGDAAV